ncbi:polysaccharide deacetylase family protein [Kitasatospora sp. NPDC002227]|uniref:polysaccharide deacetylase family protein n=1 Tax=Kitasatospora sp. NPDC002227 TaxID=3154773 RepID=UPI00331FEA1F
MPIRPHRSPLGRAVLGGLAAVLAPALVVGCGAAQGSVLASSSPSSPSASSSSSSPSSAAASSSAAVPDQDAASPSGTPSHRPSPSADHSAARPTTPSAPSSPAGASQTPSQTPPQGPPPGVPTSVVHSTASGGRTVALTFDDGPGPATGQVLDLLAQYGVHATFCEIGTQASANPALVQRILAGGHRLCDHTVHHPQPLHTLPHDKQTYEIDAAKDMIVQAGGPGTKVTWFRAPGGDFSTESDLISAQDGMRPLGWTVDPRDWSRPGVPAIVTAVQHQLHPGGVVLMHDGGGDRSQTVAALKQLLPWLVAQGYTFDFPAA